MSTAIATPEQLAAIGRPKIAVYNPGDEDHHVNVLGRAYDAPANGTFVVEIIRQHPRGKNDSGKVVTFLDRLEDAPGGGADKQVEHILSRYADKGFVALLGDGRDEDRKVEARELYIAWRIDYATTLEATWIQFVTAFLAANPGAAPPRQRRAIREQLAWLEKHRRGLMGRKEFICRVCSQEYDAQPDLETHVTLAHPGLAGTDAVLHVPAEVRVPVVVPPAPSEDVGVPGKVEDTDDERGAVGAVLLGEAKKLKLKLTTKELMGLIEDDAKVVNAVIRKVAEAKAAAVAKSGSKVPQTA